MAGPTPELKSNELGKRVKMIASSYADTGILNEIAWQGAFRDSLALEGTPSEPGALIARGVLLGLKQDNEGVDLSFDKYATRYGIDWGWHACRASLALFLGRPEFVVDLIEFGVPEGDIDACLGAYSYASQAGFMISASEYIAKLRVMKSEVFNTPRAEFMDEVVIASEYLRTHGINERDLADRIAAGWKVASRESNVTVLGNVDLSANEEGISFNFCLRADVDRCLAIQQLMDEALINNFDDPMFEHLSVGVFPADMGR